MCPVTTSEPAVYGLWSHGEETVSSGSPGLTSLRVCASALGTGEEREAFWGGYQSSYDLSGAPGRWREQRPQSCYSVLTAPTTIARESLQRLLILCLLWPSLWSHKTVTLFYREGKLKLSELFVFHGRA